MFTTFKTKETYLKIIYKFVKYMEDPKQLRVQNIFNICKYTDVTFDFVISLIEDN